MIYPVSKEEVLFCIHVHSHGINCPVAETSESIKPNDNNLELTTIAYTFAKIDSNLNFNTEYARSFGDRELLSFSSEATGETEKKTTTTLSLLWNTKARRKNETEGPNRQRNKTFLEKKGWNRELTLKCKFKCYLNP